MEVPAIPPDLLQVLSTDAVQTLYEQNHDCMAGAMPEDWWAHALPELGNWLLSSHQLERDLFERHTVLPLEQELRRMTLELDLLRDRAERAEAELLSLEVSEGEEMCFVPQGSTACSVGVDRSTGLERITHWVEARHAVPRESAASGEAV